MFRGNRQYISQGNLTENPKVHLFLIDYAQQARVKLWGEAWVIEEDPELLARLISAGYDARPEQVMVIHVNAWDTNCPQHIPQRLEAKDVGGHGLGGDRGNDDELRAPSPLVALRAPLSIGHGSTARLPGGQKEGPALARPCSPRRRSGRKKGATEASSAPWRRGSARERPPGPGES